MRPKSSSAIERLGEPMWTKGPRALLIARMMLSKDMMKFPLDGQVFFADIERRGLAQHGVSIFICRYRQRGRYLLARTRHGDATHKWSLKL